MRKVAGSYPGDISFQIVRLSSQADTQSYVNLATYTVRCLYLTKRGRFTCIPRGRGRWPWRKAPPGRSSPSGTRRRRQSLGRTAARSWTTSKTSPVFTFPRFFGLLRSWTDENRMKVRIKLLVVDEGRTFPIARWRESRQTMSEFGEFSSSGHQDVPTKHGRCSIVEALRCWMKRSSATFY